MVRWELPHRLERQSRHREPHGTRRAHPPVLRSRFRGSARVGGKGANLAVLARAGVAVPPGFCVTTRAFDLFIASLPNAETRFGELERLDGSSVEDARGAAESMRLAPSTPSPSAPAPPPRTCPARALPASRTRTST